MLDFGILRFVSLVMDWSCMAPLTPAVIVMREFENNIHIKDAHDLCEFIN